MTTTEERDHNFQRRTHRRLKLMTFATLFCLAYPIASIAKESIQSLLATAKNMRDTAPTTDADAAYPLQQQHLRRWLSALLAEEQPVFKEWHSERATFANDTLETNIDTYRFPGTTGPGSRRAESAHGSHGGPLIHFTHFNESAHRHIRENKLYDHATLRALGADGNAVTPPPPDAMVVLTGWWPLAAHQPTPIPLWDPETPLRASGANGYLNWPRVDLIAAADGQASSKDTAVNQFAGRTINDARVFPRDALYRVKPSPAHLRALMQNPQFRKAAFITLGRPMKEGDELALVGFHLLHFGLQEGVWLTYWWDMKRSLQSSPAAMPTEKGQIKLPNPWQNYRGDMTLSPEYPQESDGSPAICFNPWFDAVFTDSGQGNGLVSNCLSCHLRAGIPAAGRLEVTRGRPLGAVEDPRIISTRLLWSLANPARSDAKGSDP